MEENQSQLFLKYAQIKKRIAELEAMQIEVENQLFDEFDSEGVKLKEFPFGRFAMRERKTYEYSNMVEVMKQGLASQKKKEEASGQARLKSATRFVVFKANDETQNETDSE